MEFLTNFRGKLQTDGYSAYESLAKARGDRTLIGCWAHARRGLHEALAETRLVAWFVRQIGQLYAIEKKLREQKAGPALRGMRGALRNTRLQFEELRQTLVRTESVQVSVFSMNQVKHLFLDSPPFQDLDSARVGWSRAFGPPTGSPLKRLPFRPARWRSV